MPIGREYVPQVSVRELSAIVLEMLASLNAMDKKKERLIEITANPALTGFTASKILWVRNNEPEIYEKCAHILLPKDYVRYMLTGDFTTEVSDASGMQLLDVPNRCWSERGARKARDRQGAAAEGL